jgi:selenocysteine-specific elongation factor
LRTPNDTVGGGVVVETAPKRHRRRDPRVIEHLERRLNGSDADRALAAISAAPFIERGGLLDASALDAGQLDAALAATGPGVIALVDESGHTRYLTAAQEEALRSRALDELDAFHEAHPLRAGMPLEELRSRLRVAPDQLASLIGVWAGVGATGGEARLSSFTPTPTAGQQADIDRLLAALRANPASPPTPTMAPDLLAYAVASGLVVDAGDGVIFDRGAFEAMTEDVRRYVREHGAISLAQARDLFGTSRRFAQALLEHLDRLRVTRRVGEVRVLR